MDIFFQDSIITNRENIRLLDLTFFRLELLVCALSGIQFKEEENHFDIFFLFYMNDMLQINFLLKMNLSLIIKSMWNTLALLVCFVPSQDSVLICLQN